MKKSISYLPPSNRKDLNFIVELILSSFKETEMIILYGSYARNDFIVYDERYEFGKRQFYVSDYDILVVTNGLSNEVAMRLLNSIEDLYYERAKDPNRQPPVQFICEDIEKLNKYLSEGRYFYSQIKQQGVILYDSQRFKLTRRRKLNYDEIMQQAQEYFNDKFTRANEFLIDANNCYSRESFVQASFYLHQACENYIYAIRLVFTLENPKLHNLSKLINSVKEYSDDLIEVFQQDTPENKRLFELIKAAYINGRYDPDFVVNKPDIETLIPKVKLLRNFVERICVKKIKDYKEQL